MKKSIKILVEKLENDEQGSLKGGFSAIKGGFKSLSVGFDSVNDKCTNSTDCNGSSNVGGCTNQTTCFI